MTTILLRNRTERRVILANLQHLKVVPAALTNVMSYCDIDVKFWVYSEKIMGLRRIPRELIYNKYSVAPRTYIAIYKGNEFIVAELLLSVL